jgi:hypothetical protein
VTCPNDCFTFCACGNFFCEPQCGENSFICPFDCGP